MGLTDAHECEEHDGKAASTRSVVADSHVVADPAAAVTLPGPSSASFAPLETTANQFAATTTRLMAGGVLDDDSDSDTDTDVALADGQAPPPPPLPHGARPEALPGVLPTVLAPAVVVVAMAAPFGVGLSGDPASGIFVCRSKIPP